MSSVPTSVPAPAAMADPPAEPVLAFNGAVILGQLVDAPEERELPSGTRMLLFSVTVRQPGTAATSVPCEWFEPPKHPARWRKDELVVVTGRVRRRFFRAGGATASRTAVEVVGAQSLRRSAGSRRIVTSAKVQLDRLLDALV